MSEAGGAALPASRLQELEVMAQQLMARPLAPHLDQSKNRHARSVRPSVRVDRPDFTQLHIKLYEPTPTGDTRTLPLLLLIPCILYLETLQLYGRARVQLYSCTARESCTPVQL